MQNESFESENVVDDDTKLDIEADDLSRGASFNIAEENTTPVAEMKEMGHALDTSGIPSARTESNISQAEPEEAYLFMNEDNPATPGQEELPSKQKSEEGFGVESYGDTPRQELEYMDDEKAEPVNRDDLSLMGMLDQEGAQQQSDIVDEQPTLAETQPTAQQVTITEPAAETKMKAGNYCTREAFRIRPAEVMYKAAAGVIQDPTVPLHRRQCSAYIPGTSVRGAQGGSNRQVAEMMRHELLEYRRACSTKWHPNPACTVPIRAKRYVRKSRVRVAASVEEWRIWEERDKDRRDHELAVELGYETLVGNLLYIDIPGGNDINRSWQNFLSEDVMEWGFPYEKGTIERPRMKQPEPYLAHQVKEKLWKFPKARTFQAAQEE